MSVAPWADKGWIKPAPGLMLDWCQTGRAIGVCRGMLGDVLASRLNAGRAGWMGDRPLYTHLGNPPKSDSGSSARKGVRVQIPPSAPPALFVRLGW